MDSPWWTSHVLLGNRTGIEIQVRGQRVMSVL
jgi:hypothetical protein